MRNRYAESHVVRAGVAVAVLALAGTVVVHAALTETEPTDWKTEATSGAPQFSLAADGCATVSFAAQSRVRPPSLALGGLQADLAVAAGAFVGDYSSAGVEGLCFRAARNGEPFMPVIGMRLVGASGRMWQTSLLRVSETAGDWVICNVPLDDRAAGGWSRNDVPGADLDALWAEDIRNVAMIGFSVMQKGFNAQSCSVDDFRLIGNGFVSDEGILFALRRHFGDSISNADQLTAAQRAQDSDRDGRSDLDALLAGDDPGMAVEIVEVAADGITIRWPCVKDRAYTVKRGASLTEGLKAVVVADIVAAENGSMTYKDTGATGSGAYLYKVIKK